MEYNNVIRRKLVNLTEFCRELEPFKNYSLQQYAGNYFIKRTGERLVQLVVENMVDINSIIIASKNLPPSKDFYSSFETLGIIKVLPPDFAGALIPCTGMRNRLVHEYDKIEDGIIFNSIPKLLEMTVEYIGYLNQYLGGV